MMIRLNLPTKRGVVLNGVLFKQEQARKADTVMIAITGIHGNFYSNPFYYNIGDSLNGAGMDFIYAQTNNAFDRIKNLNVNTGKEEVIGSWNERFFYTNVHTARDGDFSQAEKISHSGALLVGTYDNFTDGDPSEFLRNLNAHLPTAKENKLIFIEGTGHTYQMKHHELADKILRQLQEWNSIR